MASFKIGYVYIIETVLTKPPKEKFAICVCVDDGFFIWINTDPRKDGHDQIRIPAGCHELIKHDSHIDLSRVVKHADFETENAREFPRISRDLCERIIKLIDKGPFLLPEKFARIIRKNILSIM